jgi:NAD-dependent dihydropyrimidine dehydrogenase PreA subunit
MLALLDQADADGLVLQPQNTQDPLFVCCCCGCCCAVLTTAKAYPHPAKLFVTNYYAEINPETCELCGECVDRCQMESIALGAEAYSVVRDRCIGCGLCVTSCPTESAQLHPNPEPKTPPSDSKSLYLSMLKSRYGPWKTAGLATRIALGLKF